MRGRSSPAAATAPRDRGRRPGARGRSRPPAPRSPRAGAAAAPSAGQLRAMRSRDHDDPARPPDREAQRYREGHHARAPPTPWTTDSVAPTNTSPARTDRQTGQGAARGAARRQREEDEHRDRDATTSRNWWNVGIAADDAAGGEHRGGAERMPAPQGTRQEQDGSNSGPTMVAAGSLTPRRASAAARRRRSRRRGRGRWPVAPVAVHDGRYARAAAPVIAPAGRGGVPPRDDAPPGGAEIPFDACRSSSPQPAELDAEISVLDRRRPGARPRRLPRDPRELSPGSRVCGEAADGAAAIDLVRRRRPTSC